jgi:hypothetical protein
MNKLKIYCKGCSLKTRIEDTKSLANCMIATYNKYKKCPCIECLVKVMCNDKALCRKRVQFISSM